MCIGSTAPSQRGVAALATAHADLLNDRAHTSNGRAFVGKYLPEYYRHSLYWAERAVSDRQVITANGLAPLAFNAEIFRTVAPAHSDDIPHTRVCIREDYWTADAWAGELPARDVRIATKPSRR